MNKNPRIRALLYPMAILILVGCEPSLPTMLKSDAVSPYNYFVALAQDPSGTVHIFQADWQRSRLSHTTYTDAAGFTTNEVISSMFDSHDNRGIAVADFQGSLYYSRFAGITAMQESNKTEWDVRVTKIDKDIPLDPTLDFIIDSKTKLSVSKNEGMERDEYRISSQRIDTGERRDYPPLSLTELPGVRELKPLMRNGVWEKELLGIFYDRSVLKQELKYPPHIQDEENFFEARLKQITLENDRWIVRPLADIDLPFEYQTQLADDYRQNPIQIGGKLTTALALYYRIDYDNKVGEYKAVKITNGELYQKIIANSLYLATYFLDDANRLHVARYTVDETTSSAAHQYLIYDAAISTAEPIVRHRIP